MVSGQFSYRVFHYTSGNGIWASHISSVHDGHIAAADIISPSRKEKDSAIGLFNINDIAFFLLDVWQE